MFPHEGSAFRGLREVPCCWWDSLHVLLECLQRLESPLCPKTHMEGLLKTKDNVHEQKHVKDLQCVCASISPAAQLVCRQADREQAVLQVLTSAKEERQKKST